MLISALRKVIKVQSFKQHICSTSTQLMCEAEKARQRALEGFTDEPTIFDKIIAKEIPADIFYEDEKCMAFNDVAPQAPVHFLVIPKIRIPKLEDAQPEHQGILGHLMQTAGKLGKSRAPEGFRLVVNNGAAGCQSVYYLHLHVLGGRQLTWPPG